MTETISKYFLLLTFFNSLIVDITYTSPYFTQQLQTYLGSQEEIDFNKKKETKDYTIDYGKRVVTRKH